MALIQCPECEQMISDKARKCPNCGYVVSRISKTETHLAAEPAKANSAAANKKRPIPKLTATHISIGVIIIIGGIAWCIYSYNEEQARLERGKDLLAKIELERQETRKKRIQQEEEERRRQEEERRRQEEERRRQEEERRRQEEERRQREEKRRREEEERRTKNTTFHRPEDVILYMRENRFYSDNGSIVLWMDFDGIRTNGHIISAAPRIKSISPTLAEFVTQSVVNGGTYSWWVNCASGTVMCATTNEFFRIR